MYELPEEHTQQGIPPVSKNHKIETLFERIRSLAISPKWIVGVLALSCILTSASLAYTWYKPHLTKAEYIEFDTSLDPDAKNLGEFPAVLINAKAAIVYDVALGEPLLTINATESLPLASLTKLMTAMVAYEALGNDTLVRVDEKALQSEGDSGLQPQETWRAGDLFGFTLLTSSNDGASAIASAAGAALQENDDVFSSLTPEERFVVRMNERARAIGLATTSFENPTGLDTNMESSGAYGSAEDVAKLLAYLYQNAPDAMFETRKLSDQYKTAEGTTYIARNTNERVGNVPGLIVSKTGFTDLAGGNLAVLLDVGLDHPIAIVVLGSTREGRFADTEALVRATLLHFAGDRYNK